MFCGVKKNLVYEREILESVSRRFHGGKYGLWLAKQSTEGWLELLWMNEWITFISVSYQMLQSYCLHQFRNSFEIVINKKVAADPANIGLARDNI